MIDNVMNISDQRYSTVVLSCFIVKSFDHWNINLFLSFCCLSALTTILDCAYPALPGGFSPRTPWNGDTHNLPPAGRCESGLQFATHFPQGATRTWLGEVLVCRSNTLAPAWHLCMTTKRSAMSESNLLMHWSAKFRFRWYFKIFSHFQLEILRCWLRQDVGLRHTAKVHQPGCSGMFKEVQEVLQWFDWIAIDSID